MNGQLQAPAVLLPGKDPGTHWIEGWVGPKYGRDGIIIIIIITTTTTTTTICITIVSSENLRLV
jgi:hypothetical protein